MDSFSFKEIAKYLPYGVTIMSMDGTISFVNERFAHLYGYEPEELLGKHFSVLHTEEQMKSVNELYRELLQKKEYSSRELWHKHKTGRIFPMLMFGKVIEHPADNPAYFITSVFDIKKYKKTEADLTSYREIESFLSKNSPDIIWKMDSKLRFTYLSNSLYDMFGYKPEEWLGTYLWKHFKKIRFVGVAKIIKQAIREYKTFTYTRFETWMLKKDGTEIPVEIIGKLILKDGKYAGLQGSTREITDRVEQRKELQTIYDRLKQLIRLSNSIIWETNEFNRIKYISPFVAKLLGYSQKDLIGRNWCEFHHEEEVELFSHLLTNCKHENKSFTDFHTKLRNKDGSYVYVSSSGLPLFENNRFSGFRGVDFDITRLKKMDSVKNDFINTISHETLTPLTAIKEAISIMQLNDLHPTQKLIIDITKNNVNRLCTFMDKILDYQALISNQVSLNYTYDNICEHTIKIIEKYKAIAQDKSVALVFHCKIEQKMLRTDFAQVSIILDKLINNALQHTYEGSVVVASRRTDQNIEIAVQDSGSGISEKDIQSVFSVFSHPTYSSDQDLKGKLRVDLAIVQETVKLLQGTIRVESQIGEGTTFIVTLPIH